MTKITAPVLQIKITLDGNRPPIWRRFLVQGSTTLDELHAIIQVVMGWHDCHLHEFTIDGVAYGNLADDVWGEWDVEPEERHRIIELVPGERFRFRYVYDFGDGWVHTLLVEEIVQAEKDTRYPVCLKGRRACPPEDVGGVGGYQYFLEAISDPAHAEHDRYLEWIGGSFDAEVFDLEDVNASLRQLSHSAGRWSVWPSEADQLAYSLSASAAVWTKNLTDDLWAQAENLALRRDMVALLTYLRDTRVTGTRATGNFPLKTVREISARFVEPPILDTMIGDQVYRLRSEDDVWSLYFRHVLAAVGGLATGGPGRRWRLTSLGERFLNTSAPLQVWHLLVTWWRQVNWSIASRYEIPGDGLTTGFRQLALDHLLGLPLEESVQLSQFADPLIEESRLVWPIEDQDYAQHILRRVIEWTLVDPLIDFGVLTADYRLEEELGPQFRRLSALQITSFGVGLLRSLRNS